MDLDTWLDKRDGVVRRRELLASGVAPAEVRARVRHGEWQVAYRGIVTTHRATGTPAQNRCRAALIIGGDGAYLSCVGAALLRGLPVPDTEVHVSVPRKRSLKPQPGFRAHRDALAKPPSMCAGLPTIALEAALIQSFGCLTDIGIRRALVIDSVRDRLVSADRIVAAVTAGTRRGTELLELLAICEGSQSEAEIAMLKMIRASRLAEPTRQYAVAAGGHNYRLDLAYPAALLAIEVDGKAWHFNAERRTSDIRRDAVLAAVGWLTLRFTYEQITTETEWVAACIGDALRRRTES